MLLQPKGSVCIRLCYQKFFAPPFAFGGWWVTLEGEHNHWLKFFGPGVLLGDGTWASRVSRPRSPHFPSMVSCTTWPSWSHTSLCTRLPNTPAYSCFLLEPSA